MAHRIEGDGWKGLAFDIHTLSSAYLGTDAYGHEQWDNTRSEMGELVYQLKYRSKREAISEIVELLERIKGIESYDYLVPIPPSDATRVFQPVALIATALGEKRKVPVLNDLFSKNANGPQLKNIDDSKERKNLLTASITMSDAYALEGRRVLLVDDLYRSGATLNAAANLLLTQGKVAYVGALTMTKTRSRR